MDLFVATNLFHLTIVYFTILDNFTTFKTIINTRRNYNTFIQRKLTTELRGKRKKRERCYIAKLNVTNYRYTLTNNRELLSLTIITFNLK